MTLEISLLSIVVLVGEGVVEEEVADVVVEAEAEVEAGEGIYI
jgi:hypothetical protein